MRKMKFRAWNKDMMMYWGVPFYEMFSNTGLPENPKDCIWMQHVGIEDKNKIGIYEDDIVRIVNTDGKILTKRFFIPKTMLVSSLEILVLKNLNKVNGRLIILFK